MQKLFIIIAIFFSITLTTANARDISFETKITGLYIAFFNRASDQEGLDYWTEQGKESEKNGENISVVLKQLSEGFARHLVFKSTYDGLSPQEFVGAIYRNALGRDGDSQGIDYWTGKLDGGMNRSDMVAKFVELSLTLDLTPANFPDLTEEELAVAQLRQDLITNKSTVALAFTQQLGELSNVVDSQNPESDPAYLASIRIISQVTEDPVTVVTVTGFLYNNRNHNELIYLINNDETIINIPSSEYVGLREKAILNHDNYIKYIRAAHYLENLNWQNIPEEGNGIFTDSNINAQTSLGYIITTYNDVSYEEAIINGIQKIDILSITENSTSRSIDIKMNIDLVFKTIDNNILVKLTIQSKMIINESGEETLEFSVNQYNMYDEKNNEHIEILDFDTQNPKLYIGSEGYVTIDPNSDNFTIYGDNNTELTLLFKPEEAIYETRYTPEGEFAGGPVPYDVQIYSPKDGQGIIENILNGIEEKDLYFAPFNVSEYEPPKFYENHNDSQLLEYSNDSKSVHVKYKLLNNNLDNINVSVEWYVNTIKVNTNSMYELGKNYDFNTNIIKVVVVANNGDMVIKREQTIDDNIHYTEGKLYTNLDATYDIDYRTNTLNFDLDILSHEYFENIDLSDSEFSWYLESVYGFGSIIDNTQYNKIPTISANQYKPTFDYLYLRIYSEHEIKLIRFRINLLKGSTGYKNHYIDTIESIEEANLTGEEENLTNNSRFISGYYIDHFDNDNNGLDDIIYTSLSSGLKYFLNVSYQNHERIFEAEKITISSRLLYLGDFDGDGTKEALDFNRSLNNFKIISLEKGNIHTIKDINISAYMNRFIIKAVTDMNNDAKDDLIVSSEGKLYIYENLDDLNQIRLVGPNQCQKILAVRDINHDSLKDIICSPGRKEYYLYTDNGNGEDYFSSDLIIQYYLQNVDNTFTLNSRQYSLIDGTFFEILSVRVFGAVMLDNSNMAVSLRDKEGNMLYTYDLNNDNTEHPNKTPINAYSMDTFFTPKDIDHDGLSDLVSYQGYGTLNILHQKENFIFESDYNIVLSNYYPLTDRFLNNAFLDDIDNDGSLEIVTINGENKFSYINFK